MASSQFEVQEKRQIKFLSPFKHDAGRARHEIEAICEVPWNSDWFNACSDSFNSQLAVTSMAVAASMVRNTQRNNFRYAVGALESLGFQDVDVSSFKHRNETDDEDYKRDKDLVAYAFAHQLIPSPSASGKQVPLVVAAVRGTSRTCEWRSNANVADAVADGNYNVEYHEGFDAAAEEAYSNFADYIERCGISASEAKIWLIGHSRGGAVANIIGSYMCESDEFDPAQVFVYAFATPPVTRRTDVEDVRFNNIFNIIDPRDYVPRLPLEHWGFRRFGKTMYLPAQCMCLGGTEEYYKRAAQLFEQFAETERPTFDSIGPTARLVRDIASVSPTLTTAYTKVRQTKFGRKTFAQYFQIFTEMGHSKGARFVKESLNMGRLSPGPFRRFAEYFLKNTVPANKTMGTHSEEGYLACMMAAAEAGLNLPASADARMTCFTAYGEVDVVVKDASGKKLASVWKGSVERVKDVQGALPAYYDSDTCAASVWMADGSLDDYCIELRDRDGHSFGVTVACQDAMGRTLSQDEYGPLKIGAGATIAWSELASKAEVRHTDIGCNLSASVSTQGGKRCDAVGAECLTAGDWAVVRAFEGRGSTFKGWYADGRNPKVAEPLNTSRDFRIRVAENRSLVAVFE
ncbi:lipase family protein [Adlercreutzia sp. ZJ154]|uniref:lipase family protein n=1 Tax=Adlercreutzia sp. ZJ154 TaxID=2709790 RepID=UPI0013EB0930|nr:lipase family protein [Adlercreutzia sp. ZJ154]